MREESKNKAVLIGFCGIIATVMALTLLLPKRDFSQLEKRYLQSAPPLTGKTLLSGEFTDDAEKYMADHIVGRDVLVGLNAYWELLTSRQAAGDIYAGKDGYLFEKPIDPSRLDQARKNVGAIENFARKIGREVDFALVPSAGFFNPEKLPDLHVAYKDDQIVGELTDELDEGVRSVDVCRTYGEQEGLLFYKTDHHWTSLGAYEAARTYVNGKGRTMPEKNAFQITTVEDFYGTSYSRSALWLKKPDVLELWDSGMDLDVYIGDSDTPHKGPFFMNRLEETDKYTVFLDGNHPVVRIKNHSVPDGGELLLIRDSFGNSMAPFLAAAYSEVYCIDLRYYKGNASDLVREEDFDDILVCYTLGNFAGDQNVVWLR
ncbi:MAG: DHHW family protein [Christensenellales bacterium]|jgi:hypothetical protein